METKIALLLSLPTSMGGYGIPQPDLNAQVTHSFSGARHPERFRCDLYWPTVKLALEYDSHQYHASSEKVVLDSTRRMKIESKKIHVLSVTKQQIYNPSEFEKLVGVIARYLSHRIRINRKDFNQRRQHLRAKLGFPGQTWRTKINLAQFNKTFYRQIPSIRNSSFPQDAYRKIISSYCQMLCQNTFVLSPDALVRIFSSCCRMLC